MGIRRKSTTLSAGPPPAQSQASDPLDAGGALSSDPAPKSNDPLGGLGLSVGGAPPASQIPSALDAFVATLPPVTEDPLAGFETALAAPGPVTAIQGLDGLRGAVNGQAVREHAVDSVMPHPVLAGALQEISAKLGKLDKITKELETVSSVVMALTGRLDKMGEVISAQATSSFNSLTAQGKAYFDQLKADIDALQHDVEPSPSTLAEVKRPTGEPAKQPLPRNGLILLAIQNELGKVPGRMVPYKSNPEAVLRAFVMICTTAGVEGTTPDEIKAVVALSGLDKTDQLNR